jgi:hypothetical protein
MSSIFSSPWALLLLPVLFLAVSFLPGFIAGMLETRMVWPYASAREITAAQRGGSGDSKNPYEAPQSQEPVAITPYALSTCREIQNKGFIYQGVFYDRRGGIYRIRSDFWLSPDRYVLANVGGGTLAGIELNGTNFYTRLQNGHCLMTLDEPKRRDSDPSGLSDQVIVTHASLDELLAKHRQRIEESALAIPYSERGALAEHKAFRSSLVELLIDRGLARFVDEDRNRWKHTLPGAWVATWGVWGRELTRQLKEGGLGRGPRTAARGAGRGTAAAIIRQIEFICWIVLAVGGAMSFSRGPAHNQAQLIFRIAVPAVALLTLLVLQVVKRVAIRPDRETSEYSD